jgi:hypothetical protein
MAPMRFVAAILFSCILFAAADARADINQVSAREVARNNNCTPSKIDVYQASLGSEGSTIYQVTCTIPKMADANAPKPASSLLVSCRDNMCSLLRPMTGETK